jgi:2,4-dienoyl-CoA reductase-like NADH-dependent reductase (Old Yellow Enzyme family)
MTAYARLFEPIRLGSLEIRNRIVLTGHGTGMGADFKPNDQMIAYYAERAKGEVGLIMLGSQQVHPTSPGITNLLCNYDDGIIPGLAATTRAVHAHGARIFGYLSHMGLASSARPVALWSASAAYEQKYGEVAHAMSHAEIEEITQAFAAAAARCVEAGMDGLEVHCGHGLLLQQFLSPLTNFRTDRYGGSVENRARFACEVLAAVRKRVGAGVPLGIRCSGDELVPGGLTAEDMAVIVPLLVRAGALDYVDVSAGTDGDLVSNMLHEPPMGLEPAPYASVAGLIRKAIPGMPVIHGTRIHTPELAEEVLARGDADMIGMCRALIADPHLPRKARTGARETITPCVGCEQACFGRLYRGRHISCVGNPATGRERAYAELPKAASPRRVLVIGGGPAGMEAACLAALRGHRVEVREAGTALGGRLNIARLPPGREEWGKLIAHKRAALERAGVAVRLGKAVSGEMLAALAASPNRPDLTVIATGGRFARPNLPGAADAPILSVDEAVSDPTRAGQRVLVVDLLDRQPGMVTAIMLAEMGRDVEIATPSFHVGYKLEIQNITYFYGRAARAGVHFSPVTAVIGFEGGRVCLRNPFTREDRTGERYDTIVYAAPGLPRDDLVEAARELGLHVAVIGDAYAPRDTEAAILDGFQAGAAA